MRINPVAAIAVLLLLVGVGDIAVAHAQTTNGVSDEPNPVQPIIVSQEPG